MTNHNSPLTALLNSVSDAVIWIDRTLSIAFVNTAALNLFGFAADEIRGMAVTQLFPDLISSSYQELLLRVLASPEASVPLPENNRLKGTHRQGHKFHVEGYITKIELERQIFLAFVLKDIPLTEGLESLTAEKEYRFQQIFSRNHEVMLLIDPQGGSILDANDAACQFYGYAPDQLRQMNIQQINQLSAEQIAMEMAAALAEKRNRFIFTHRLASGDLRTVEVYSTPLKFNSGNVLFSIVHDISEEQRIEKELKRSSEQLARAIEGSGVGLWEWVIPTGELIINERWANILGYSLEELAPTTIETWNRLANPEDLERSYRVIEQHIAGQMPLYECEVRMRHKDGRWATILDRGRVTEWDEMGHPVRLTGTHLDITKRREMEEQINYRSRFEELLLNISTRFINLDGIQTDEEINRALREIGEFEEVDRTYVFLFDPELASMSNTHEWCREGIEPQIENLQSVPTEMAPWWMSKLKRHEAIYATCLSEFPEEAASEKEILEAQSILSVAVIPIVLNKSLLGFVGFDAVREEKRWTADSIALLRMFSNILSGTFERNHAEKALRQSQARNSALLNAMPDMLFRVRSDGLLLDFSSPNENNLALPAEKIIGSNIRDILGDENGSKALECIKAAIRTGMKQTLLYDLTIGQHTENFEARFVASATDEVIAIVRDVSESIRLEQMKSDFINRASHDLRTPLTTIMLMVRLLDRKCSKKDRQVYWQVLKDELERENNLIENLLMVGRLESKRWEVKLRPVDSLTILQDCLLALQPQTDAKEIQVVTDLPEQAQPIRGEDSALRQIFINLLHNAIKFSPTGGTLTITCRTQADSIQFMIQDQGIGIPEEDLPHIFSRFFRGHNAIDNEIPGSGVGLYIVKSIVEQFGGNIRIESELNLGTTIEINFSLWKGDEGPGFSEWLLSTTEDLG